MTEDSDFEAAISDHSGSDDDFMVSTSKVGYQWTKLLLHQH
jgi:hypothetical protein